MPRCAAVAAVLPAQLARQWYCSGSRQRFPRSSRCPGAYRVAVVDRRSDRRSHPPPGRVSTASSDADMPACSSSAGASDGVRPTSVGTRTDSRCEKFHPTSTSAQVAIEIAAPATTRLGGNRAARRCPGCPARKRVQMRAQCIAHRTRIRVALLRFTLQGAHHDALQIHWGRVDRCCAVASDEP